MGARLARWIAVLGCLASAAAAQEAPLLPSTATFSSAGCYSFLPRCFVFAAGLDSGTAVVSTTAATIAVHTRADDGWAAQQVIANPDYASPPTQYSPQRQFGHPSGFDGNTLLIAGTSPKYNRKDVVYAFTRTGTTWQHVRTLAPPRPADYAGTIVTGIAVSGTTAAVCGVRYRASSEAGTFAQIDLYKRDANGQWIRRGAVTPPSSTTHPYTHVIALAGDTLVVANPSVDQFTGRAFVYENGAAGWKLRKTLGPPSSQPDASFGESIAIDGNTIAISARGFVAPNATITGAAFLFERVTGVWQPTQQITAPPSEAIAPDARFAIQVHLAGERLLVDLDTFEADTAFAFLYERRDQWRRVAGLENDNEGSSTAALDGDTALANISTGFSTQGYSFELPPLGTYPALDD